MKPLVERLKELREDRDLTQKEVAAYLGIRQNVYSRYETGKNEIQIHNLIPLAHFYEVSVDYILGLTDERKPYPRKKER